MLCRPDTPGAWDGNARPDAEYFSWFTGMYEDTLYRISWIFRWNWARIHARLRYSTTILHQTLPLLINDNAGIIRFYSYLFLLSQARNLSHVFITSCLGHTLFLTSLLYLVTLKRHETLTGLSHQSCSFYSYSCWHSHNVRFMFVSRKLRKLLDTSIFFYVVSTTFYYVLQDSICFYEEDLRYYLIGNQCWAEELWSCINRLRLSIKDLQSSPFERADRTLHNFTHLPTPPTLYFTFSLLLSSFSVRNPSNIIATLVTVLLPVTLTSGSSPIPNSD